MAVVTASALVLEFSESRGLSVRQSSSKATGCGSGSETKLCCVERIRMNSRTLIAAALALALTAACDDNGQADESEAIVFTIGKTF